MLACERAALASGALAPIATTGSIVDDAGMAFVVRRGSSPEREPRPAAAGANPFLPPEPALTVGELTPTHVAVLNKFPVVPHHLLLVTKRFVSQEQALDHDDFGAVARCLDAVDGLAFYNSASAAGASQPHKHLQVVPLPFDAGPWAAPVEALFDAWAAAGNVTRLLRLPFRNAFALLEPFDEPARVAERMAELYAEQLAVTGIADDGAPRAANDEPAGPAPYNLLVTRRWMLMVPRSRECFGTISINALAFAGSLFVRDEEEMQDLREAGPMRALKAVSVA